MTFTRIRAFVLLLLMAGVTAASASGQTRRPQDRPEAAPPVEADVDRTLDDRQTVRERERRFLRPVVRVFQDYTLRTDDVVREVRTVVGDVTIEGLVEQDVVVVLGSARIASTAVIEGTLAVIGGSAEISQGARVGRDLVVIGGTLTAPSSFSPEGDHVVVGTPMFGSVMRDVRPWVMRGLLWGRLIVPDDVEWVWATVGIFFMVYLLLNIVLDRPVAATAEVIAERPVSAFVSGLLVLLLAVPVLAIVAASVIGLAVIPFLLCGLIVAGLIGKAAVIRAMGQAAIHARPPVGRLVGLVAFLIGFLLLTLAYMVPLLGFVAWALTSVLGLGAAAATFRTHLRRERKVTAPTPQIVPEPVAAPAPPEAPASVPELRRLDLAPSPIQYAVADAPPVEPPPPPPLPPPPSRFDRGLAAYPRATFLDRLAAFALDCILVAIANGLLELDRHQDDGFYFFLLLAYHIAFWAWKGTTLGGIICNVRVTRTDGTDLRFVDSLVRGLSSIFSIAALGIGCFWMLQDPERQMWHDKIAGTLVVKVPRDLVLP